MCFARCICRKTHFYLIQDFEALTPNLLARTMETVEGGGIIVMLLSNLSSLRDLYSLTMDMHSRFRTPVHGDVKGQHSTFHNPDAHAGCCQHRAQCLGPDAGSQE